MTIRQLMRVPAEVRDLEWLMAALQAAIELEHSTIPPYLCAYWSIRAGATTPATVTIKGWIQSIVYQEMLHMGLACNLLTAIGGTPNIYCAGFVPRYPGPLPGHVRTGLTVGLAGLAKDDANDPVKKKEVVQTFMQIEYPELGPIALARAAVPEYRTIGDFYDAISKAFDDLQPALSLRRQMVEDTLGLPAIAILPEAQGAIRLIKEQGEGTAQSPLGNGVTGDVLKAEVPPGGYDESKDFDVQYTGILKDLHYAWANGDPARLNAAIYGPKGMDALTLAALDLLGRSLPTGTGRGIKGPSFVFRP